MKGIYIFLADGFEDMEALGTLDVLRRGGLEVSTVAVQTGKPADYIYGDRFVTSSRGVPVVADLTFDEFEAMASPEGTGPQDVMVFPGGMPGTRNLAATEVLMDIMKVHFMHGGTVAAICAAPGLVASQLPGLEGRKFTCFDGFEDAMIARGARYVKAPAVSDGNLVTGRGAGCAIDFACEILRSLKGGKPVAEVRHGLML